MHYRDFILYTVSSPGRETGAPTSTQNFTQLLNVISDFILHIGPLHGAKQALPQVPTTLLNF